MTARAQSNRIQTFDLGDLLSTLNSINAAARLSSVRNETLNRLSANETLNSRMTWREYIDKKILALERELKAEEIIDDRLSNFNNLMHAVLEFAAQEIPAHNPEVEAAVAQTFS